MKSLRILLDVGLAACLTCAVPSAASAAGTPRVGVLQGGNACSDRANSAGSTTLEITSGGMRRRYVALVPEYLARGQLLPLVLDFHGSGSDPDEHLAITGMREAAERRGFIVVLPVAATPHPSGGFTWNVPARTSFPDDLAFVRDVLDDVERRFCVDPSRVYASGFSGGARLATAVACSMPDRIAALAAVGGLRSPAGCTRPVPVIAFHGTDDPVNPYAGGGPAYWGYGVEEAVAAWRKNNRCGATSEARAAHAGTQMVVCRGHTGAEVVFHRIDGAGHVWPGSRFPFPPGRFGRMTNALDATALLLDFFERRVSLVSCGGYTAPRDCGARRTASLFLTLWLSESRNPPAGWIRTTSPSCSEPWSSPAPPRRRARCRWAA